MIKKVEITKKILAIVIILMTITPITIYARSSSEVAEEIRKQQEALANTQKSLEQANKNLAAYNSSLANTQGGLPQIENEIKILEAEIESNKYELDLIKQSKELKELEKEQKEIKQNNTLKSIYRDWRIENATSVKEVLHSYDFKKYERYASEITGGQSNNLDSLAGELGDLNTQIDDYEAKLTELDTKSAQLAQKKKDLEDQIRYLSYMVQASGNQINSLHGSVKSIQSSLTSLSEEQRQAILREEEILRQNQGTLGNTDCLKDPSAPAGTIYICGNGRDLYQGHGVGMSQYGAKGAAEQGWTALQILQFYYTGTSVVSGGSTAEITVKYCQTNPALDAYQDGCSNGAQPVTERVSLDTYLAGLGEMPESWHIEARKAQMIAARTYALRYTGNGNPNIPICLTTYCQVSYFKNGDTSELAVAQATSGQVITSGGSYIEALYSADNNQGYGTADSDTRFQNLDGSGTYTSYLRSVNDNQFAQSSRLYWSAYCQSSPCGLWKWKTYSYSIGDIASMLNARGLGGWVSQIGGLASISFERDASLRVKKVILNGNSGSRVMGGWWFKYHWNEWVSARASYDYIYSQTYFLNAN